MGQDYLPRTAGGSVMKRGWLIHWIDLSEMIACGTVPKSLKWRKRLCSRRERRAAKRAIRKGEA